MAAASALAALSRFDRIPLIESETPIQRLGRLEIALGASADGVRLFVKRDDLTGVGGGGNKLRKLEFLLGEAVAQGCDTFITTGGIQSNHARQSAAAAARQGLACELILTRMVPRDDAEYRRNGNVLLDGLFGATVHELPGDADSLAFARQRATELEASGRRAYVAVSGGSSPIGCLGYAACAAEILSQEDRLEAPFSCIVVPNGSAGTHAGLAAGMAIAQQDVSRVRSYAVAEPAEIVHQATHALAGATLALLDRRLRIAGDLIRVDESQLGAGYGIPTPEMFEAVRLMARTEGLLLDPVYGGKAFAGMMRAVRDHEFPRGASILFIMTGGLPGLFAYRIAFDTQPPEYSTAAEQAHAV